MEYRLQPVSQRTRSPSPPAPLTLHTLVKNTQANRSRDLCTRPKSFQPPSKPNTEIPSQTAAGTGTTAAGATSKFGPKYEGLGAPPLAESVVGTPPVPDIETGEPNVSPLLMTGVLVWT